MFETLVVFGDEGLGADDARVREIACTALKPAYSIHVEIMGTLFFQNLPIDYAGRAVSRFHHSSGFIYISAIAP